MSKSEVVVWQRIKASQTGFKYRRQYPVLTYFLDFYCPSAKVALEIDGEQHDADRDFDRDDALRQIGVLTLRISSLDCFDESALEAWLEVVRQTCSARIGRTD